jgi:hypothetical protein
MLWFVVFGVIALGGLVMVVCFGVSLWRKSQALLDEVGSLLERADQLLGLLDQIEVPGEPGGPRSDPYGDDAGAGIDPAAIGLSRQGAT